MSASLALASLPSSARTNNATSIAVTSRQWLARWLAAFNNARASTYAAFVREHIPLLVPYLDDDLGLREASGGFILLRSEETGPREITAWVRDRNWDRFSQVVLTIGDGRIDDLSFLGAPPPTDFSVRRLSEREALEQLRRKLRAEAAGGRFSGAVLVANGDRILFREAYGTRTVAPVRATTPDTRFCIGSMGKMFIAVAVLQLVQHGRLRLTDTIATLLPAYPDTSLARQVTVEHMLTHSGGTGDFFGADYDAHQAELRTPSDFVRLFGNREPAFPPGSRWGYSNFGFIVLGAIVEQVSGVPWDAYLDTHVFRIAGMTSTSPLASYANTAEPCTGAAQTGLKPLPFYVGLPAGGGYSTLGDLHLFAAALRETRLLDATHLDLLTRARVAAGSAQWSLGLRVAVRNAASCYGHGGSAPGINADFAAYPDSGYHTIVLSNRGHPHAVNVANYIGARLPLR
ncbi:serine hydrolase domain-containing protein [Steroidobacter flavus]|uniref:Serine hydrolase domain-containing protein n=1 Tax=Steroidobacter flavus TaxID=1842136 RepID=A0ABV8SZ85_9GAMM